jgi:chromosome segregation ATPase
MLDPLPDVTLEVRQAGGRPATYALSQTAFVIGTVAGCDLRLSGADLPPLICLITREPATVSLRKLTVGVVPAFPPQLHDGDRLVIGVTEILLHIQPGKTTTGAEPGRTELQEAVQQLRRQVLRFQQEKEQFERDRAARTSDGERHQQEMTAARQEMLDLRRQLNERHQERSDRLDRLQQENEATRQRLAEREQQLALVEQHHSRLQQQLDARHAELEKRAAEQAQLGRQLDTDRQQLTGERVTLDQRAANIDRQTQELAQRQQSLNAGIGQYEADVVRLDRQRGDFEAREREHRKAAADLQDKQAQLQKDTAELEEQIHEVDAWRVRLAEIEERLTRQEQEQKTQANQLVQRAASIEGQQATLAAMRTRLERVREDLRIREQHLDEQHANQQTEQQRLDQERRELERLRAELDGDRGLYDAERQQHVERSAVLESAVRQLREAQDRLSAEEERQHRQASELDAQGAQLAAEDAQLQGRMAHFTEAQQRLEAERQSLRDRSIALAKAEQTREALQEQLRRRADELAVRQKAIDEHLETHRNASADFDQRRTQTEIAHAEAATRLVALEDALTQREAALQQHEAALAGQHQAHRTQAEQLATLTRSLHDEQARFRDEQQQALERSARERSEFETLRREAAGLLDHLPEVELRVGTGIDRLGHAREQLRDHLAEVHTFVQQCQDELERLRSRVQLDMDRLELQEQELRKSQDEHRLAMVAFRQQLIDWQGQIADMKRLLASDETRLERRQARVEEQVKAIDATSERLARQAEVLDQQHREVIDRRQEVDRHLVEMREWYRRKLRDLAGVALADIGAAEPAGAYVLPMMPNETAATAVTTEEDALIPIGRGILRMGAPVDDGDQRLGDTLRALQLVDDDALTALLAEARRQRRSLRQVLLASGAVTLYQLALIEAGNVEGLMLGPVRVIDRIRATPMETVYRVFDPRRGVEAILRHLGEAPMQDAIRPDEFRQRFGQAVLSDPHVAATLEVLEINGRPAALEPWLTGLAATDWPPLAAAPGVCYRLLTQAARGLDAAHRAGLIHGRLSDALLFLGGDGLLKVCGLGEPPWLTGQGEEDANARTDLRALGAVVSGWCTPSGVRRGARAKPLPEALVSILYRLNADGDAGYPSTAELLHDLEQAAGSIPPNAEAWDRLLRYVREHGTPDAALRRSA